MDMRWTKVGRVVNDEGTTTIYCAPGTPMAVESRKRHIPHANGIGTWDHTSFWVLYYGKDLRERQSLQSAKEFAEEFWMEKVRNDRP